MVRPGRRWQDAGALPKTCGGIAPQAELKQYLGRGQPTDVRPGPGYFRASLPMPSALARYAARSTRAHDCDPDLAESEVS
ncbi:hypothetical protein ACWHA1_26090 [Streptomyces decoyicus]